MLLPVLDFGGIESRAIIQAAHWPTDPPLRFCCFTDAGSAASAIREMGYPVDELGTRPSVRNVRGLWQLWRYLRRRRPNVVHGVSGSMTVHGLVAARLAGVPIRLAEEVGIPTRGTLGRLLFPWTYRLASCVIGVSDAVVDHIVEHDGVPRSKVRRIYNAVERRFFEAGARYQEPRFTILTAGRLAQVKGDRDLLVALAPMLRSGEVTLRIAGDGPERGRLSALTREMGLGDAVEFLGFRSDLPSLLAGADLFVLPSRMEGFGLAVVEAMAAGVPVVATNVGGVPEVVPGWASDALVAPGDEKAMRAAVERVWALPEAERRGLGARLREHAAVNFGPERYVQELLDLYGELGESQEIR